MPGKLAMYKEILNREDENFYYYEWGAGNSKTLLFLPGYADSALMYEKLARSLEKSYRVIALDLPMIHKMDKIYNLAQLTDYVESFVHEIGLKEFTLAGFSSCGVIAINYAYRNPDKVKELILLNSSPRFILSKVNRKVYQFLTPLFSLRPILFLYSRLNTANWFRKLFKSPHISNFTKDNMRKYYYSVFGTAFKLIGESVLVRFKNTKTKKKIIFFKDDTIVPWHRYQKFVEKLDCEVVIFSEGLHADKRIYWEKLKTLWLKSPKIKYQDIAIEKGE
jgi:pimeloyl-ACP methyl ester carboxylesterase